MRFLVLLLFLITIPCYANYAVVDFNKPSTEKRFFIYSDGGQLLYSTWTSHGSGSGKGKYATTFSNEFNSHASSLGKYQIKEVYYGKHGKNYRLTGLSKTNSNAYKRYIEIHGATYIGNGKTGNSWGCFAVPREAMHYVFKYLKPGDYLYAQKGNRQVEDKSLFDLGLEFIYKLIGKFK